MPPWPKVLPVTVSSCRVCSISLTTWFTALWLHPTTWCATILMTPTWWWPPTRVPPVSPILPTACRWTMVSGWVTPLHRVALSATTTKRWVSRREVPGRRPNGTSGLWGVTPRPVLSQLSALVICRGTCLATACCCPSTYVSSLPLIIGTSLLIQSLMSRAVSSNAAACLAWPAPVGTTSTRD